MSYRRILALAAPGSFTAFVAATVLASGSLAYADEDCSQALILSHFISNSSASKDWRLSQYISNETYDEAKTSAGAGATLYGIPFHANYDEYQAASNRAIQITNEHLTVQQVNNIIWTGLGPDAADAYITCVQSKGYGLYLNGRTATEQHVELILAYRPTGGTASIDLTWVGAPTSVVALPERIGPNEQKTIIVDRPAQGDAYLISVNAAGLTVPAIAVTPWPPDPPVVPDPPWAWTMVTMLNNPPVPGVPATGTAGSASLPEGYEVRNIRYHSVSATAHEFMFDLHGPSGLVKKDVVWVGSNGERDDNPVVSFEFPGHKLNYEFSNYNDGVGRFNFQWW